MEFVEAVMNHSWYEILNTKEISVHVHVPLYCSLGPIPMIHTFQLQIDPSIVTSTQPVSKERVKSSFRWGIVILEESQMPLTDKLSKTS